MKNDHSDFYCPSCGAVMKKKDENLYCSECHRYDQVCDVNSETEDFDFSAAEEASEWGEPLLTIKCGSCGGEHARLSSASPAVCAYCGSIDVVQNTGQYGIRPGWIAPFRFSAPDAASHLEEWLKKRILSPFSFNKERRTANLTGVFIPYWSFDASANSTYTGQAGNYYNDTELDTSLSGERTETKKRRVRKLRWRMVSGNYDKKFRDIIFCDSVHIDVKVISSVEPFKLNELVKYDNRFVSGYAVDRYVNGLEKTWARAKAYMGAVLRDDITANVKRGSNETGAVNICTQYTDIAYKLLLLPLWVSSYRFRNKVHNTYINGQTGKIYGSSPVSALKIAIAIMAAAALTALLVWVL